MRAGVIITGARHADIFRDHGVAFAFELQSQDIFENFELDADQAQHRGQRDGILHQVAANARRQLFDRERTELHAVRAFARLDLVAVVEDGGTRPHESEMAIHGVLIERYHDIDLVAETEHGFIAGPQREKNMPAADDGLVGIVGVQMQPAAHENARQNIARRGDTLACGTADRDREINFCHDESPRSTHFDAVKFPAGIFFTI